LPALPAATEISEELKLAASDFLCLTGLYSDDEQILRHELFTDQLERAGQGPGL
jgi:hypothetical protein